MKVNLISKCLVFLCLVCSCAALSRLTTHLSSTRDFLEKASRLDTFNDVAGFSRSPKNNRLFAFKRQAGQADAYLRFRIPDVDPSGCRLVMRIKARPYILKHLVVRSARKVLSEQRGVAEDDVAVFTVDFDPKETFIWKDGTMYVGVCAGKGAWIFAPSDTIELLDFKFELR